MSTMTGLAVGDTVRIAGSRTAEDIIYVIRKIRESDEGTMVYLLKSDASPITLLYYEKDGSRLERA